MNTTLLLAVCLIVGVVYIYTENMRQHFIHDLNNLKLENYDLKNKIKYLQSYKNDVSKTFKILDNDLMFIKENIKEQVKQNGTSSTHHIDTQLNIPNDRISLLTADTIQSLLNNISPPFEGEELQQTQSTLNSSVLNPLLSQNQVPNQVPHQVHNQVHNQVPNQVHNQVPSHTLTTNVQNGQTQERTPSVFGSMFNRVLSETTEPTLATVPVITELQFSINGTDYSRYLLNRQNQSQNNQSNQHRPVRTESPCHVSNSGNVNQESSSQQGSLKDLSNDTSNHVTKDLKKNIEQENEASSSHSPNMLNENKSNEIKNVTEVN
jgi:hypothetical protein